MNQWDTDSKGMHLQHVTENHLDEYVEHLRGMPIFILGFCMGMEKDLVGMVIMHRFI